MKTIKKDKIVDVLDFLATEFMLFAPKAEENFDVNFAQIKEAKEVELDFYNSKSPAKKLFFGQREILYSYSKDSDTSQPDLKESKQRVIFGIRPCDAASLMLLDSIFEDDIYKDPYYIEKRNNTTIFTLACDHPQSNCFCTSFGLGPFSKQCADIFVVDMGDEYLFEAVTEKGKKILQQIPSLTDAAGDAKEKVDKLKAEAESQITKQIESDGLPETLSEMFDHSIWEQIQQKCLGCGICTYFCPTCHCFDIVDETAKDKGCRVRIWDSCMFPDFTSEASSHNPRATGAARMRQRIMHKFNWFVENNKQIACVGCGRCIKNCPAALDITNVIKKIKEAK